MHFRTVYVAAIAILFFAIPCRSDSQPWDWDSNNPSGEPTSDTREAEVFAVIRQMVDLWNAHNIEGYMDLFWKSKRLLVVVQAEQVVGWANVLATYWRGYPDRKAMGLMKLERVKIQNLSPDISLALTWWQVESGGAKTYCTSTMNLQRFPDGWKVVAAHTTFLEP
jgi:ketosteroid isomerase-like protein